MTWRLLLAQTPEIPTTAYGLIGAALVALISGLVFIIKWLLNRVEELEQQLIDKVVPALTESTVVVKETADLLREISAEGRRRGMRNDS